MLTFLAGEECSYPFRQIAKPPQAESPQPPRSDRTALPAEAPAPGRAGAGPDRALLHRAQRAQQVRGFPLYDPGQVLDGGGPGRADAREQASRAVFCSVISRPSASNRRP